MQTVLLLILAFIISSLALWRYFFATKYDPREPPVVSPKILFVGNAVGMMRKKVNNYLELRSRIIHTLSSFPYWEIFTSNIH